MAAITLTVGHLEIGSGQHMYGYYPALSVGSVSGELSPSGTTSQLVMTTGLGGDGQVVWSIGGDHTAALTGLTGIKINGTTYPVTNPPNYGGSVTDVGFGSGEIPLWAEASTPTVDLVGVVSYDGPTWVNNTADGTGVGTATLDFSATGRAANDLLGISIATANTTATIATPTGFTAVPTVSPQSIGTNQSVGAIKFYLFQRISDGTETTVGIADSGDHTYSRGFVIRPASGQTIAIEASAGKATAASTTHTGSSLTTGVDDCLILTLFATDRDSSTASYSGATQSGISNLTERFDFGNSAGLGSGLALYTAEKMTAGSVGALSATSASNVSYCAITLALKSVASGGGDPTLTPSLHTNTQTFYGATVSPGAVALAPVLLANSQSFYAVTLSPSYVLAPSLVTSGTTLFAPTVQPGTATLSPPLLTGAQTFYTPSLRSDAALTPPLLVNGQTFPAPIINASYGLAPALLTNTSAVFAPIVSAGETVIVPPLLSDGDTIFAPTVAPATVSLSPPLLANGQTFYGVVIVGDGTLSAPLLANQQSFFVPAVITGPVQITAPRISDGEVFFGGAVVAGSVELAAELLTNEQAFFGPEVLPGTASISPPLVANDNQVFAADVYISMDQALDAPLVTNVIAFPGASVRQFRVSTVSRPALAGSTRPTQLARNRPPSISKGRR